MRRLLIVLLLLLPAAAALGQSVREWQYQNITGTGTATVKSSPGVLHNVCINNPAATETIALWDGPAASGTKIGTITVATANPMRCFTYDVAFWTNLTVVTATAASDITVSFR